MRIHFNAPSLAKAVLVALISVTALSACQTNSRAGQGQIHLSSGARQGLQTYMHETFPTIFALSEDGIGYSYFYCAPGGCRDTVTTYHKVLENCNKLSPAPCRLLAISRNIVWKKNNGEPYTLDELFYLSPSTPQKGFDKGVALMDVMDLCKKAYDKNIHQWFVEDTALTYVKEAQDRGFTTNFCAKQMSARN